MQPATQRRQRIASARLYLVAGIKPGGRALAEVLGPALAGGVEVFQLREKEASDSELLAAAEFARELCNAAGALLIINDRPDIARAARADGVHVGQDDMPVGAARELAGPDLLVGLSTHDPGQVDAAAGKGADYIGVGPVHATPTKPGRPAVGLALVAHAARAASLPWFAIGGIDEGNVESVLGAGASRLAVVRAISEAADPHAAAQRLRAALTSASAGDEIGAQRG